MPKLYSGSPWQQFKQKWQDCNLCHLCESRRNIVLARGNIPCDVLFIGEAPGASEDDLGKPFIGPAGKLLDQQIEEALRRTAVDLRICFTNLVCCVPKDRKGGKKIGDPDKESISSCTKRLEEFIDLSSPRMIVAVGDLAKKYLGLRAEVSITHPAAILRAEIVRRDLMYQRCVVTLENAFREL